MGLKAFTSLSPTFHGLSLIALSVTPGQRPQPNRATGPNCCWCNCWVYTQQQNHNNNTNHSVTTFSLLLLSLSPSVSCLVINKTLQQHLFLFSCCFCLLFSYHLQHCCLLFLLLCLFVVTTTVTIHIGPLVVAWPLLLFSTGDISSRE